MGDLPRVVVLSLEMPLSDMPRLYKGADCFVLPSRGEVQFGGLGLGVWI